MCVKQKNRQKVTRTRTLNKVLTQHGLTPSSQKADSFITVAIQYIHNGKYDLAFRTLVNIQEVYHGLLQKELQTLDTNKLDTVTGYISSHHDLEAFSWDQAKQQISTVLPIMYGTVTRLCPSPEEPADTTEKDPKNIRGQLSIFPCNRYQNVVHTYRSSSSSLIFYQCKQILASLLSHLGH